MLEVVEKAFFNTLSITETLILIGAIIACLFLFIYVPFGILKANKKLREIEKVVKELKDKNDISLD